MIPLNILSLFSISISIPIIPLRPNFQSDWMNKFESVGCWLDSVESNPESLLSIIKCLEIAKERGYPHVFIFENNVDIEDLFSPTVIEKINLAIEKNPSWKLLYFDSFSFFIVRDVSYQEAILYFQSLYVQSKMNKTNNSDSNPIPEEWYSVCELSTVQNPLIRSLEPLTNQKLVKHDFTFAKPVLQKSQSGVFNNLKRLNVKNSIK